VILLARDPWMLGESGLVSDVSVPPIYRTGAREAIDNDKRSATQASFLA
jgi:hypothetical protein